MHSKLAAFGCPQCQERKGAEVSDGTMHAELYGLWSAGQCGFDVIGV
jgi:hypothetical protein